ncbi:MAG: hypothetical protein ACM3VS_12415 [Candidatus Dadabacteria bacterium]
MKKVSFILVVMVAIVACNKYNGSSYTPDCTTPATWSADVAPIIQSTCATGSGCHGAGSRKGPGALTSYAQVYNYRTSIRSAVASGSMPPGGGLSASQRNAVLCWIDNGASNN